MVSQNTLGVFLFKKDPGIAKKPRLDKRKRVEECVCMKIKEGKSSFVKELEL